MRRVFGRDLECAKAVSEIIHRHRSVLAISILVSSLAVVVGLVLPMTGDADKVQGYTKNDDGQIVAGVTVHLYHESSGTHWYQDSGQDGHYSIRVEDKIGWFRIEGSKTPNYLPKVQRFYREDEYDGIVIDVITWKDSDQDGISDNGPSGDTFNEQYMGTNPNDPNTDDDEYNDYWDPNPLKKKITHGPVKVQWYYQQGQQWRDAYEVYLEAWIAYNYQSKIVGYEYLKQKCTLLDVNLWDILEKMRWQEDLRCVAAGYDSTRVFWLEGTGDVEWSEHGSRSFSGQDSITFDSDNFGDGYWNYNATWYLMWQKENDFDKTVTSNPSG